MALDTGTALQLIYVRCVQKVHSLVPIQHTACGPMKNKLNQSSHGNRTKNYGANSKWKNADDMDTMAVATNADFVGQVAIKGLSRGGE